MSPQWERKKKKVRIVKMKAKLTAMILLTLFLVSVIVTVIPLQGAVTTYYVSPTGSNSNSGNKAHPWLTIQYAVNTVPSGAVINVAAGTYVEQVVISKALTLKGAGDKTIIRPGPSTLAQVYTIDDGTWNGYNLAGIIIVMNVAVGTVTTSNLQVDGKNVNVPTAVSDPCYPVGIVYGESSGTVQNVKVVNMNTTTSVARSYGIWLNAFTATVSDTITDCTVVGYYRNGIMTAGDTLTFDIDNNKVTGPGTLGPDQLPNGIVLADGSGGTVSCNIVTKNHYNNLGDPTTYPWLSIGIMGWDEQLGVAIDNNVLSDNDVGIGPTSGDYISNNQIYSCLIGIELEAGAADNIIIDNVIRNNYYGIHLLGPGSPYYTESGDEPGTGNVALWNNILKNTVGVQNWDITQTFRAKYNWWGDCSGPYNLALNSKGKGNSVSNYVDFTPWAKKAY